MTIGRPHECRSDRRARATSAEFVFAAAARRPRDAGVGERVDLGRRRRVRHARVSASRPSPTSGRPTTSRSTSRSPTAACSTSSSRARSHDPLGPDGSPGCSAPAPLSFELIEPFRHWRMRLDGDAVESTVEAQMRGQQPEARRRGPGRDRASTSVRRSRRGRTARCCRGEARVLEEQDEGALMGGPRFEQLCPRDRARSRVGDARARDRRRRPPDPPSGRSPAGTFRGHAWQSSVFPSGRAFGYIVYPPRDDGQPTYNEGYLFEGDGELIPATGRRRAVAPAAAADRARTCRSCSRPANGTDQHQAESADLDLLRHGRRRDRLVPGPAAGDRPLHARRRVGQRDDGALDAARPGRASVSATNVDRRGAHRRARRPGADADTGLDDFGGDTWREGLEVLRALRAETEAHLNELGEHVFYGSLVRALTQSAADRGLVRPAPGDRRAGGGGRAARRRLPAYRLDRAVAPPRRGRRRSLAAHVGGADAVPASRRLARGRRGSPRGGGGGHRCAALDGGAAPLDAPQSATGPMEDHDLMALEFKAQMFLAAAWVPSYADWFARLRHGAHVPLRAAGAQAPPVEVARRTAGG